MTVEVENPETQEVENTEEVKKTNQELAKAMYPDKEEAEDKSEDESEAETEAEDETKEEDVSEREGKEETGEQEETEDGEDPEGITLTLSKDSPLDESALESAKEFAKEKELPQEVAQAMLEREESAVSSYVEKQQAEHDSEVESWAEAVRNHPKLGGENLEKTMMIAKRPLEKFGGEEMNAFLDSSGFGNHPDVIEYHYKIGKAMGDDEFINGIAPSPKPKTLAEKMYPNDVKKE